MDSRRYLIVVESGEHNYSAYAPDVPGCIATGATVAETVQRMREALVLHLAGLAEDGLPIPEPTSIAAEFVDVAAD